MLGTEPQTAIDVLLYLQVCNEDNWVHLYCEIASFSQIVISYLLFKQLVPSTGNGMKRSESGMGPQ
jgi:hypothetical protein